jgi:hypothetical protein
MLRFLEVFSKISEVLKNAHGSEEEPSDYNLR